MAEWFSTIESLACKYKDLGFILPLHPNPNVQEHKDILKHVVVVPPMDHESLLNILIKTRLVITDSGGLQEESSFYNKKCLVCREFTERKEAVGKSSFMVREPKELPEIFEQHVNDYEINFPCPFGDGRASEKIYEILKELYV